MKARIHITLKPGVLDAQGRAVGQALSRLGFTGLGDVRVGKYVEIEVDGEFAEAAERVEAICRGLLANPVIEDYRFDLVDGEG